MALVHHGRRGSNLKEGLGGGTATNAFSSSICFKRKSSLESLHLWMCVVGSRKKCIKQNGIIKTEVHVLMACKNGNLGRKLGLELWIYFL